MYIYFLFNLLRPWDWTDAQTANVISVVSAAATVGALLYAYSLERKNSKKINDLAEITNELSKQNKLLYEQNERTKIQLKEAALPVLKLKGIKRFDNTLWVCFVNEGKRLQISNLEDKRQDFSYNTSGSDVLPEKEYVIYATPVEGKKLDDCRMNLLIEYKDIYGNPYSFMFNTSGENWTSHTYPKY